MSQGMKFPRKPSSKSIIADIPIPKTLMKQESILGNKKPEESDMIDDLGSSETSSIQSSDNTEKREKIEEEKEQRISKWKQSEGFKQLNVAT